MHKPNWCRNAHSPVTVTYSRPLCSVIPDCMHARMHVTCPPSPPPHPPLPTCLPSRSPAYKQALTTCLASFACVCLSPTTRVIPFLSVSLPHGTASSRFSAEIMAIICKNNKIFVVYRLCLCDRFFTQCKGRSRA